jgi:hypothetical protein
MGKWLEEYGIVRAEVGTYFLFCITENFGSGAGATPVLRSRPEGRLDPESPCWLIDVYYKSKVLWCF